MPPSKPLYRAKVLFDFVASDSDNELSVTASAIVEVLDNSDPDWHLCRRDGRVGYSPANFLERIPDLPPPRRHFRPAPPIPSSSSRTQTKADHGGNGGDNNNNNIRTPSVVRRATKTPTTPTPTTAAKTSDSSDDTAAKVKKNDPVLDPGVTAKKNDSDDDDTELTTVPYSATVRIRPKKVERAANTDVPSTKSVLVSEHALDVECPPSISAHQQSPTSSTSTSTTTSSSAFSSVGDGVSGESTSIKSVRNLWEQLQTQSEQQRVQEQQRKTSDAMERKSGLMVLEMIKKRKEQSAAESNTGFGSRPHSFLNLPSNSTSKDFIGEIGIPRPKSLLTMSRSSPPSLSSSPTPSSLTTFAAMNHSINEDQDDEKQDHRSTVLKIRQDLEQKGLIFGMMPPPKPARTETTSAPQPEVVPLNDIPSSNESNRGSSKRSNRRSVFSRLSRSFNKINLSEVYTSPTATDIEPLPITTMLPKESSSPSRSPSSRKIMIPIRISNLSLAQKQVIGVLSRQLVVYLRRRKLQDFAQRSPKLSEARIRKNLVDELYATEKSYCRNLETAVDVFLDPLRQKKLLKKQEVEEMFGSIEQVKQINYEILVQLEAEMKSDSPRVGRVIKGMSPFLKAYTDYVNQYDDANALYERSVNKNKRFASFLEKQYTLPQCVGLDLPAFLIQPVQRIPRYRMLLSDILKRTPEDHVDYKDLTTGLKSIMGVATLVNERRRQVENSKMLHNLSPRLRDIISSFVQPHRRIVSVTEATATMWHVNNAQDLTITTALRFQDEAFHVFIFTDLLLLITKTEQQVENADVFPCYLAFSRIGTNDATSFTIDSFHRARRVRWQISFPDSETCEKHLKTVQDNIEAASKSACSKLGEEFDLRLLQEVEATRLELSTMLPQVRAELVYHRTMRQTLTDRLEKTSADLAANRAKLEELTRLVEKQQAELTELSHREKDCVEQESIMNEKVDVMTNTAEQCDKMLMLVLNKESQAFEHLFNTSPLSESSKESE